jgi:hypothetical protein
MERIEVSESTVFRFLKLRGEWLLNGQDIIVIREVQYQHVKPTEEEIQEHEESLPVNTTVFRRRKHKKQAPRDKWYITELVANGYHKNGKFVGTYNDDWCERTVNNVDSGHIDLYEYKRAWDDMQVQIDAMKQYEQECRMEAEELKYKDVIALIREDKSLQAMKVYKDMTGKTLEECKIAVKQLKEKYNK